MHPQHGKSANGSATGYDPFQSRQETADPNRLSDIRSALGNTRDVFGDDGSAPAFDAPPSSRRKARPAANRLSYAAQPYEAEGGVRRLAVWIGSGVLVVALLAGTAFFMLTPRGSVARTNQELVLLGDSLMAAGDYATARDHFENVLDQQPNNRYAQQRLDQLGKLLQVSQKVGTAQEAQFKKLVTEGDSLAGLFRTASRKEPHLAGQIVSAAREAYLRALIYHPEDQAIRTKLARLETAVPEAAKQDDNAALEAERARLREIQNQRYQQAVQEGDRLLSSRKFLEAQIRFKEALTYNPTDPYAAQRLETIDGLWQEVDRSERYNAYRTRGEELLQARLYDQARMAFREALAARPNDRAVMDRLTECERLEREAQALIAANREKALQQERAQQLQQDLQRGESLVASGQLEAAMNHYGAALQRNPNDPTLAARLESTREALNKKSIVDAGGVYKVLPEGSRPQLQGGLKALYARIKYPDSALRAGEEGRVFVEFVVDERGRVSDPRVLRGLTPECDREVLRAISQSRFTPGKMDGKPVKAYQTMFVTFTLPEEWRKK